MPATGRTVSSCLAAGCRWEKVERWLKTARHDGSTFLPSVLIEVELGGCRTKMGVPVHVREFPEKRLQSIGVENADPYSWKPLFPCDFFI